MNAFLRSSLLLLSVHSALYKPNNVESSKKWFQKQSLTGASNMNSYNPGAVNGSGAALKLVDLRDITDPEVYPSVSDGTGKMISRTVVAGNFGFLRTAMGKRGRAGMHQASRARFGEYNNTAKPPVPQAISKPVKLIPPYVQPAEPGYLHGPGERAAMEYRKAKRFFALYMAANGKLRPSKKF